METLDTVVAGVWARAEWVSIPPNTGEPIDVELDIDAVLGWADAIAIKGTEATLREGPLLRQPVETREQNILTVRIAEGLSQVEVNDGCIEVLPATSIAVVAEHLKLYPTKW